MIRIGSASVVITPPIGRRIQAATHSRRALSVRDHLEANALYLGDGSTSILLVSCDLAAMPSDLTADLRGAMAARSGVPPRGILIGCTHTHAGPVMLPTNRLAPVDAEYAELLKTRLADLAAAAAGAVRPGRLAWGMGNAAVGYNRRLCFADGTHTMHGDAKRPDFTGLEGPADPRHTALFAADEGGGIVAVVHNSTSHPTCYYGGECWSADFPGKARAILRDVLGPIPVLFFNGAQGDICIEDMLAPVPRAETPDRKIARAGSIVAGETLRLLHEAEFRDDAVLAHSWRDLSIPVRLPAASRLEWAREVIGKAERGENVDAWDLLFAHGADTLQGIYGSRPVDTVAVHALRIGDLAVATQPCELYCQFGLDIKRRSPASATAVFGLVDGFNGYCPTIYGVRGGGYSGEPILWARLSEDAGYRIVDEACALLHALWKPGSGRAGAPA
jgi:neutral ceramidase